MGKTQPKKFTSWSFSRYVDYRTCPLKAKLKHLDKISEPTNDAMARGSEIHTLAENYISGKLSRLPRELKLFSKEFRELRAKYKSSKLYQMVLEDSWGFTSSWLQTAWNDWVNCWLRVKIDCAHLDGDGTLRPIDWKTGKFREENIEDYLEQLELYALCAFIMMPEVNEIRPQLSYLDYGTVYPPQEKPIIYKRSDLPKLKKIWEDRIRPMMNDKIFAPRANNNCRWCFYRKSNAINGGGQCKF